MKPVAPVRNTLIGCRPYPRSRRGLHFETGWRTAAGRGNPRARASARWRSASSREPPRRRRSARRAQGAAAHRRASRPPARWSRCATQPDPDRYLGRGKLDELKAEIKRAGANLVACDDELAPRQERNLEAALDVPVIDRTAIILDIFADHAHSAEGKLQVELAQLEYNLARMRGLWTHLERLGAGRMDGGIGTRGPGESQIETDRRLARDRITALRRRLERVERNRGVMRARRESVAGPAGRARRLHERRQVDPAERAHRRRAWGWGSGSSTRSTRPRAPTSTTAAATWSPTRSASSASSRTSWSRRSRRRSRRPRLADLILHVVDGSEPERARARGDRRRRLGARGDRRRRPAAAAGLQQARPARRRGSAATCWSAIPGAIGVSAADGRGARGAARRGSRPRSTRPCARSSCWSPTTRAPGSRSCYELAGDLEREERADGVLVQARIPAALAHRFAASSRSTARRRRRRSSPVELALHAADASGDACRPAPTTATPGSTSTPPRRRPSAPGRGAPASAPGSRSRSRPARRPGAAALGPRRPARDRAGQRPGPDRLRLPRRDPRPAAQHRPARPFEVAPGDRIAQLLVTPFAVAEPVEAAELGGERPRRGRLRLLGPLSALSAAVRPRGRSRGPRLERVVERRQLGLGARRGARARARSGGRRARRSSAAAGRAGRCRSCCGGARPRARRAPLLPWPLITRPSGSAPAPR